MPEYDNEMSGCLFQNKHKTADNQPDYRGTCQAQGQRYDLSGWKREVKQGANAGDTMLSIALTLPREVEQATEQAGPGDDDNLPF